MAPYIHVYRGPCMNTYSRLKRVLQNCCKRSVYILSKFVSITISSRVLESWLLGKQNIAANTKTKPFLLYKEALLFMMAVQIKDKA